MESVDKKTLEDALQTKTVAEIYGTGDDSTQKFQRAPKRHKSYVAFVAISLLLIASGMAWTGYNLFNSQAAFKQENVVLDVKAPTTIASGETVTYRIEYINNDQNTFSEGEINVMYPEGFVVTQTTPAASNNEKTKWSLGMVKSREQGVIEIKGQLTGKNDETKTLMATLIYHPIRSSKSVELKKGATVTISSSVLQVEIKGPSQVATGERAAYRLIYKNFSTIENKDKVVVNVVYPEGFVFVESTPRPDEGQGTWNAQTLLAGLDSNAATGAIEITGIINSSQGSDSVMTAQIGFKNNEVFQVENEQSLSTHVANGDLILSTTVNGSIENSTTRLGETLKIAVTYENRGLNTLSGVTLRANIEGEAIDWSKLSDAHNGTFTSGQVTWTSREIPALAEIAPQAKGTVEISVTLKGNDALSSLKLNGGEIAVKISASADIASALTADGMPVPQENLPKAQSGIITYTLATDLSFSGELRYFSDDNSAIGAGPLPPQVGQTTTYRVRWQMNNTLHDADSVLARTTLPSYVSWTGRSSQSIGELQYNESTREVTWRISRLSASAGETASFDVRYTARSEDAEKIVSVINDTSLSAKDTVTGKAIDVRQPTLTTNLDYDPVGRGRGLVAAQ